VVGPERERQAHRSEDVDADAVGSVDDQRLARPQALEPRAEPRARGARSPPPAGFELLQEHQRRLRRREPRGPRTAHAESVAEASRGERRQRASAGRVLRARSEARCPSACPRSPGPVILAPQPLASAPLPSPVRARRGRGARVVGVADALVGVAQVLDHRRVVVRDLDGALELLIASR
jgi:hypothetical protein